MMIGEFAERQRKTARDLGYGEDVAAMNFVHDDLHRSLCRWLGVESRSLRGEYSELAGIEEDAVLAVQKFMRACGAPVPEIP